MYLCKTSDKCGSITSFELLEAAPVCQPTDDLDRQTETTNCVLLIQQDSRAAAMTWNQLFYEPAIYEWSLIPKNFGVID